MANDVKQAAGQTNPEVSSTEDKVVASAQQFWSKNSKYILYGLLAVILLVGGTYVYNSYFREPEEQKAAEAIWKAQSYYTQDSLKLALNGDGVNMGFLKVIDKFGGTKSGNLAKFYAGSCYLQLGEFGNAVKYLEGFSTDQKEVKLRATGLLGDAYAEQGKKKEAIDAYTKAGSMAEDDDVNSPEYLFRAALLSQDLGKDKEAIDLLKSIKSKYPSSQRAYEADKYLAKLGETK
ncbi:MAG: tetratricopeptide repeat protein [Chitinophagaceae bacterium]